MMFIMTMCILTAAVQLVATEVNVNNTSVPKAQICPYEFKPGVNNGTCEWNCSTLGRDGILGCSPNTGEPFIFIGYCISTAANNATGVKVVRAACPYSVQNTTVAVTLDKTLGNLDSFCKNFDREKELCGYCKDGMGISAFSYTFQCINCTESYQNWLKYFSVKFGPLTIFFVLVVVFHIGAIRAPTNGFVFFSQVVSLRIYSLLIEGGWFIVLDKDSRLTKSFTYALHYPHGIWSLDFDFVHHFFGSEFCLAKDPHIKIIHILALEYLVAIYPLILLIIVYGLVELHGRNFRPLVCLWKPLCIVCVRIRRNWTCKTSLIDAFSTFILLSYTKLVVVSFAMIAYGPVWNLNDTKVGNALRYDPSIHLDGTQDFNYTPYQVVAYTVLVVMGGLLPLFLFIYPCKCFQYFLNNCFRRHSRMIQVVKTFADAFQGCYKDRKHGGPDRRYFAGIYLLFRLLIFSFSTTLDLNFVPYWVLSTYVLLLLSIVILQPYKKDFYNWLDAFFITILATGMIIINYLYTHLQLTHQISKPIFAVAYSLHFIPLLYIVSYMMYWLLIRSKCLNKCDKLIYCMNTIAERNPARSAELTTSDNTDSSWPYRLNNPNENFLSVSAELLDSSQSHHTYDAVNSTY